MKEIILVCIVVAAALSITQIPKLLQEYEDRDWTNRLEEMDRVKKDFYASIQ